MQMDDFLKKLTDMIWERRKITSPLYQVILKGEATRRLLQNFVIHRYPIKNIYTRNVMGVGCVDETFTTVDQSSACNCSGWAPAASIRCSLP